MERWARSMKNLQGWQWRATRANGLKMFIWSMKIWTHHGWFLNVDDSFSSWAVMYIISTWLFLLYGQPGLGVRGRADSTYMVCFIVFRLFYQYNWAGNHMNESLGWTRCAYLCHQNYTSNQCSPPATIPYGTYAPTSGHFIQERVYRILYW